MTAHPLNVTPASAISLHEVTKAFGARIVLDGVNLVVPQGHVLAIVGESGCGKSTLLRLLAGLDQPDAGDMTVEQQESIVFQDARLLPWRHVWENVSFGLKGTAAGRREKALMALEEVGLVRLTDSWPATLSGGEAQRVALARALIRSPRLLLLDEPFGALDALTRLRMHKLLQDLWVKHGFTVALVTHDVDEALSLADRVIVLGNGKILDSFKIDAPRPRDRLDPKFGQLRQRLLRELGVPSD